MQGTGRRRCPAKRELARQSKRAQLPSGVGLALRDGWSRNTRATCPCRNIVQRHIKPYLFPCEQGAISWACSMYEDIPLTGKAQHAVALFAVLQCIESMLPQTTRVWIVCMLVNEITGHRKRSVRGRRKGQDAAKRVLLHQEIACSERQAVLWNDTYVFKAAFCMQLAVHDALLTAKIVRRDEHTIMNLEPEREMSRILKLVPYVAPEVGYMPTHAEWCQ